jgi:hypothetical protein
MVASEDKNMGWYYGAPSCKEQIAELIKDSENHKTIAHCLRGFTLWTVAETPAGRYIGCFLLRNGGDSHGWGYKPMDESMGPCEVNCPLGYLEMVPDPGGFATEWRKNVGQYHARVNRKLTVGETIKLTNGHDYKVTSLRPLVAEDVGSGIRHRIPRTMLAEVPA